MSDGYIEHLIAVTRNDIDKYEGDYNTAETLLKKAEAYHSLCLLENRLAILYGAQDGAQDGTP